MEPDEEYYRQKFLALAEWLKAREEFYDKQALDSLDMMQQEAARRFLASGNATKCARMWIRNHVLLPEKVEKC
jgi:hypothetical protein